MMQIGTTCDLETNVSPQYFAENILFEDCDINPKLIDFMGGTGYVSFTRDGMEYFSVKPEKN